MSQHSSGRAQRDLPSNLVVPAIAGAAAIGGALAGCHPTGTPVLDPVYCALAAGLFTVAGARTSRGLLLVVATVAVAFSRSWLWVPAGAGLALAFGATVPRRVYPWLGALTAALTVQAVLRWPHAVFHGFTALVAGAVFLVVLISAWVALGSRWRRVTGGVAFGLLVLAGLVSVPVVLTALLSKGAVDRGQAAAKAALSDVGSANAPAAVNDLKTASLDLGAAYRRTSAWWTIGGELVPVVAQQRRAVVDVSRAGRDLAAQAATEAGAIDFHNLDYRDGQIDLASITALTRPVVDLDDQIASAQAEVAKSRSQWLVSPIVRPLDRLQTELAKARKEADLAAEGVQAAPGLLGGAGPRNYVVLFMTPAETRGLDGFIGAYAELRADDGRVSLVTSGNVANLDLNPATAKRISGQPDYVYRYGTFDPQDHLEDLTYSPDFPTVENVVSQLYPQVTGAPVDGVMALDPDALAALLQFTGPVTVSGLSEPLTSANAADILLKQQYVEFPDTAQNIARLDILQQALSGGFQALVHGSLPDPQSLSSALDPVVQQGRLLFWVQDPSEQALLRALGLDGSFPTPAPGVDGLAVTISNSGNSKIDAYVEEHVSDQVNFDPSSGTVTASVTVKLDNTAPASGLPLDVIGSRPGSGLPVGTSDLWVSLYSPLRAESATVDGKAVSVGGGVPEAGVEAYSAYVVIPAEETGTLVVTLKGTLAKGRTYAMDLRLQPLANPVSAQVSVSSSGAGWVVRSPSGWSAGADERQQHEWSFAR